MLLAACGSSGSGSTSSGGSSAGTASAGTASSGGALTASGVVPNSPLTNTTALQTAPATKDLSSINWWIWYRPLASIDPVKYDDYPEDLVIPNMCESLFRQTAGMKTVPDLAQSYSWTTPTTLVLHIRQGVKFWDGTTMTAQDVVYSLERNLVPSNASIYYWMYHWVKSMAATGPYTVTIKFTQHDVEFIPEAATMGAAIVEKAYAQKKGINFGTPQGGVMCTGPYKLQSWNGTSDLVMVRNPNYWDKSAIAKTAKITFEWPQDPGQVAAAFENGTFAGGFDILSQDIPILKKTKAGKLYIGPSSQSMEIDALIDVATKGAIANPLVRKALSMSINRADMVKVVADNAAVPAYAYAPPGYYSYEPSVFNAAYAPIAKAGADVAAAKKLVQEAGAVAKQPIVFAFPSGSPSAAFEAEIVQQSGDAVGLNIKIKTIPEAQYGALFSDPKSRQGYSLILTGNYDQSPDPLALYTDIAAPGATSNFNSFNDPTITKEINQATATDNLAKRAAETVKIQSQVLQQLPWIPLFFQPQVAFVRNGICGVRLDFSVMTGPWANTVGGC